ncbi:Regulator of chromosome condensation RCC1 [Trinorchestia longiramus]|nr:Regulator of chromosome condensation RCC1 [Trinorchestia longiramus]
MLSNCCITYSLYKYGKNLSRLTSCETRRVLQAELCSSWPAQYQCYSRDASKLPLINRLPHDPDLGLDLEEHVYEGKNHKLGLKLFLWGVATQGALGRSSFIKPDRKKSQDYITFRRQPHRLDFGDTHKVIDVSCGYGFTVFAVNSKGRPSIYGTGLNKEGQLGYHKGKKGDQVMLAEPAPIDLAIAQDDRVIKVSCGRAHTLASTKNGAVFGVGCNSYGQCGRAIVSEEDSTWCRTPITGLPSDVRTIEAGQDTSFMVTKSGEVWSWGWGADGQHGREHYNLEPTVGRVGGDLLGQKVVKVSCRADCALALSEEGDIFGWGNNEYGQLRAVSEDPQMHTPRLLPLPSSVGRVVDVGASGSACFLVNDKGDVYSWGFGPLGRGPDNLHSSQPQLIPPPLFGRNSYNPDVKVVSVVCGVHMVTCITDGGNLYSWGRNTGGNLGLGHLNPQSFPVQVCMMGRVVKASCGVDHSGAIALNF